MTPPKPAETKLVFCVWHRFSQWHVPDWLVTAVRQRYPDMRAAHLKSYERLREQARDADILVGWSIRPEQFAQAARLKWIHSLAAGVGQLMYPELRRSAVVVTNARGVHAVPMAEYTLGLMLSLARHLPSAFRYQQQKHWAQQEIWDEQPHPMELNGRTLAIVGYGAIGHALAERARGLGMRIVAVKKDVTRDAEGADEVYPADKLADALSQADFVVLTVPETPESERMFGRYQFGLLKQSAYFLNIARGKLVDQEALLDALQRKRIAGAAIDVADPEPLPPDSPLWLLDNLIISPHLSAVSERLWHRQAALLLENLDRFFSGRELRNVVDKQRGY
ncbi:MAG: D-2-hydroxyacid dehydrogenase [Acidobacteria bacterium]|nr:D-2-hydroxyacid dehydrogenase [Acidobacteriota bacterium]